MKEARQKRGWSQERVAEQIGTDAGNVSRWERRYSSPSPYYREKLALLFEKSVDDLGLLGDDDLLSPQPHSADIVANASTTLHSEAPTQRSRILAIISYSLFCWTALPILLFLKNDRFVCFHARQSLLFFGGVTLCNVAFLGIVSSISNTPPPSPNLLPVSSPLDFIIVFVVLCALFLNLGAATAWIVGIVMTWRGKYYQLPLVSRFFPDPNL